MNSMTICKALSLGLIALFFCACSAPDATHSMATATDATHSKSMDMARSDLDVSYAPGQSINPADAKNHTGQRQTVCGVVMSASYVARSSGHLTFLYLDEPYPRQIFKAVILGEDRWKFGRPEITLKEKRVCVSGLIEEDKGEPRIILRKSSQLVEEQD
jgi:hypothetical protein